MTLQTLKPYLLWSAIVLLLGPSLLWLWRTSMMLYQDEPGPDQARSTVLVGKALSHLTAARTASLAQFLQTEQWPESLDTLTRRLETEPYLLPPNIVGVRFLDVPGMPEALIGTTIELRLQPDMTWVCQPGDPAPALVVLPKRCGGTADSRLSLSEQMHRDRWRLFVMLVLTLLARYLFSHWVNTPVLRAILKSPSSLRLQPLGELVKLDRVLSLIGKLESVLNQASIPSSRWKQAIEFDQQTADHQCRILARRVMAQVTETLQDHPLGRVSAWTFQADALVMLNRCRVLFPRPESRQLALDHQLEQLTPGNDVLVIIQPEPAANSAMQAMAAERNLAIVVPTADDLTGLLLDHQPQQVMIRILARQLPLTRISPYQTRGGLTRTARFFGRDRELSRILDREHTNYLLIGGRQLGKTSLLKELERRYARDPEVTTFYLSLRDHRLTPRLATLAELDNAHSLTQIVDALLARHPRQILIFMIDESDLFIRHDRQHHYETLQEIRSLSDEGRAWFLFAGFWDLYDSAIDDYQSPVRNFGDTLHIGALDRSACREMLNRPMAMMGVEFEADDLIDDIIHRTGQRPNLLAMVCQLCLEALPSTERMISRDLVERALHHESISEALSGWGRLTSSSEDSRLDRITIYIGILGGSVDLASLTRHFTANDLCIDSVKLQQSLMRLQLAFILKKTDMGFSFAVPLFHKEMAREPVELLLSQEMDALKQAI